MKLRFFITITAMATFSYPLKGLSHAEEGGPANSLGAAGAVSFRNESALEKGRAALIPGALMGGESYPVEQGVSLDDAQLYGRWVSEQGYWVESSVTSHSHGGDTAITLESASLGFKTSASLGGVDVQIGRFATAVTNTATWHASQSEFSEAPLLGDIFWGRHFTDTGISLTKSIGIVKLGGELWNGSNWPSSAGEGSASLFSQLNWTATPFTLGASIWTMMANADQRRDPRYASGHSHGGTVITTTSSDFMFTGDVKTYGASGSVVWAFAGGEVFTRVEWIAQQSDGEISNTNQNGSLESEYEGLQWLLGGQYQAHRLTLNLERVALENRFLDDLPNTFILNANLMNNGFEPNKTRIAWTYAYNSDIKIRTEWVNDKSYFDQGERRFVLGLTWQYDFLAE